MNRKNLFLRILILFMIVCLVSSGHLAGASIGKVNNNLEEYLRAYDIPFLIKADLNNDGREEKIAIYRQWDGEDPDWSDDQWYILLISDYRGGVLYMKDISYFQEVGSFAVKDRDNDGLKEIVVSLEAAQCWDARIQVYGWGGDSYRLMEEFKSIEGKFYL